MPRVTTTIKNHIAHVELTRSDKMNAIYAQKLVTSVNRRRFEFA